MNPTLTVAERERLLELARAAHLERSWRKDAAIEPADRGGRLPLSFAQARLWFLEQLDELGSAYHMRSWLRLHGALDRDALARALDRIVARHEALRTTFARVDGEPEQRIAPAAESGFPLREHDLRGHAAAEAELERLIDDEAAAPFDLERGPLVRGRLIRLADDGHVLLLTMHHIVSDGWSMGVLASELSALYGAFRRGEPDPLPPLAVQYADYAAWQRKRLEEGALREQAEYWTRALAGAPELLELPADRPRPARQDHAGGLVKVSLDEALTAALKALGERHGATLYMTLLAGWAAVLGRLSGQTDVVVGSPAANRGRREVEGLIGLFVNTLALRVDLSGAPTVGELIARVKARALDAGNHEDLPFEQVVERVRPARTLSHAPLFQVLFTWQNAPRHRLELPGVRPGPAVAAPRATAKFDLSLALGETDGRIAGEVTYAATLFDAATVERYVGCFRRVLEAMAADDGRRVRDLPMLSAAERRQALEGWNRTDAAYPADRCLHPLFEAQVERTPDAVALVFEGDALSYAGLNARANRLAHHLRARGVGPGVLVGLCAERSLEMMVGLLAVLKAGGAYVPLDPEYPDARLRDMLADSAPALLLTHGAAAERLGSPGVPALALDRDAARWAELPATNLAPGGLTPADLAYVLYTSGSTGRPKGVMVEHRSVVNALTWLGEVSALRPTDVVLQKTPYSFDASLRELMSPLLAGARMVIARPGGHRDAGYLLETARREAVTTLNFVPPMLQALMAHPELERCTALRQVMCGGEPLTRELARDFHRRLPRARLHNVYGPTEAAIDVTWWSCAPGEERIPIGRPMANTRLYVLDDAGEPVPDGVAGEVCIGGVQVARGYLGRAALTADRFVPDPFGGVPGARLYRTGDLGRWRADGAVELLGRADAQVKVRGYRIELGEIEACIAELDGVREAVVLAREDAPGDRRLVAYHVGGVDAEAIRAHLRARLPEHMVPAAYVAMDAIPRTPSGKRDRRALPAPGDDAYARRGYEAPASATERVIAETWAEVLGVERVGVRENFFDLGGHSLLLVRVQGVLQERLAREVAIVDLFRFPTVAALAAHLGADAEAPGSPALPGRSAEGRRARRAEAYTGAFAVVGMAARFPGAPDVERFWANLREGVHSITFFGDGEPGAVPGGGAYVGARGVLDGVELFDAGFFGINPREAEVLDPQHRVFLETAWEALESAGYAPGSAAAPVVGIFGGSSSNDYLFRHVLAHPEVVAAVGGQQVELGNGKDYLVSRAAYKLDLRGPAFTVQTACSTGLVAVHVACRSLAAGECDLALAGGAGIQLGRGYRYFPGGIASPDGRCRAFDARAAGTVGGNGVGIVALKRLEDALADGDTIRAVVRGTAINNDGAAKVGFTAPGVDGQAEAVAQALAAAGVDPETIGFVEAHGSGTELGDPVEVAALAQAFGPVRRRQFCALGAVKTNVGHLGAAAGTAGLIKAVLALEHGEIPPTLHFSEPNPRIDFAASPFFVNTALRPWPASESAPRRAGVSSLGMGGTNAHVVLEEAPSPRPSTPARRWHLLTLSARTPAALEAATDRLAAHLRAHPEQDLADVAYTLQVGRRAFAHRRALVARDAEDAVRALEARAADRVFTAAAPEPARPAVFLFPGLGGHYPGMGRGLYETEPVFRETVDRCAEVIRAHLGEELRDVLYPADVPDDDDDAPFTVDLRAMLGRAAAAERADDPGERLNRTRLAQPALFVTELALYRLWESWGVRPAALLGHSLGEWAAATVAGVWSLDDALMLVAERARLIEALPEGGMLGIALPEEKVRPFLRGDVCIGGLHRQEVSVVSGPADELDALQAEMGARGIGWRRLPMRHAFHSPLMRPVADQLAALMRGVRMHAPRIPFASNVTGGWIRAAEATDPAYWARHLCEPVRFADGVETVARAGFRTLLEVGPGHVLLRLASLVPVWGDEEPGMFASLRHAYERHPDPAHVLGAAGRLWAVGEAVDWTAVHAHERLRRVPLPTYPFERGRYWLERREGPLGEVRDRRPARADSADADSTNSMDGSPRVRVPAWTRAPLAAPAAIAPAQWLVLADEAGIGGGLAGRLETRGHAVAVAEPGERFGRVGDRGYTLRPGSAEDLAALRDTLHAQGFDPRHVVHLWGIDPGGADDLDRAQARGYATVSALADAFGADATGRPIRLIVVTEGVRDVSGGEIVHPERATVLGACLSISRENPHAVCRTVDVRRGVDADRLIDRLLAEVSADAEPAVALRGAARWTLTFEAAPSGDSAGPRAGAWLFTGRMDALGEALAEHLSGIGAGIAVVADPSFPERGEWDARLASAADDDSAPILRALRTAEARGIRTLLLRADREDAAAMRAAVAAAVDALGALHGVVHGVGADGGADASSVATVARELAALEAATDGLALDVRLVSVSRAEAPASAAFADAWARRRAAEGAGRWTSAAWDPPADADAFRRDGARIFAALAAAEEPCVVVSADDADAGSGRIGIARDAAVGTADAASDVRGGSGLYERPALESEYRAPASDDEARLVEIWRDLLGVREIGVRDSFFDLGGHSLLGVQLLARVRESFRVELPLHAVFEAPTVAALAEVIRQARDEELASAAAEALRVVEALGSAGAPEGRLRGQYRLAPIAPRPGGGEAPLSFAQERLWFIDRLQPGGTTYNLQAGVRIPGGVDERAMERALGEVVRRHEALRTTFHEADGAAVQRIAPFTGFALPVDDLSALGAAEQEAEVRRRAAAQRAHVFDLAAGPLFLARLLRLGEGGHVLLFCVHHVAGDMWSFKVLVDELWALHDAFRDGRASPLPELAVQYADYAVWQRSRPEAVEGVFLDYWKRRLAGAPVLLPLPTDRLRPPVPSYRGARVPVAIPVDVAERLRALARAEGATLHMVVLGAFQLLLSRWARTDDVLVGTPVAGRVRRELEALIGMFVNTVVLRTGFSGDPDFRAVVGRVREAALGAYQHQDVPFERVVAEMAPERNLSHAVLFQVMFLLDEAPAPAPGAPAPRAELLPAEAGETARFDLTLGLTAHTDGITGGLEYATDLFDRATAERMAAHLVRILARVSEDAGARISAIDLLSPAERRTVVEEWNQTDAPVPADACIHQLFEAQVARTPGAVAVRAEGGSLTYAELNAKANRLAHHLRALGVRPDARVAVSLDRGGEMMVALLAVMKAGGAYVPLDPTYPPDRLRQMLADSAPAALLTHGAPAGLCGETGVPRIDLAVDAARWAERPETNPDPRDVGLTPDHLAYVIYTSGSTGTPKGVMNPHRGVVNRLLWMRGVCEMGDRETVLQKTPFGFDVSVWELFWPLVSGARLVMARPDGHRDPGYLAETIRGEGITTVHFVPSMLQAFLEHPEVEACTGLARVVCSGEALPRPLARRLHERLPHVALYNLYGPTEAAVEVTAWRCAPDEAEASVPIGRPVPNVRIYLLDRDGRPVPVGIAGELHIGGVQVARGYLDRPGLTAERFVPDPFGAPGARLYRTGDLARWRVDGAIEFLGRDDFQVKVRGFRIELGEIEARLLEHAGVREAVVAARADANGDPRLVAWYAGDAADAEALRAHLSARLPEYMVPAAYVRLDALPLTPSGKVDRKALPAPTGDAYAARAYEPPVGETEAALAEIWAELLGVERVGRHDNFFALGGHSLRVVTLIERMRRRGLHAEVRALFTTRTLAELAGAVGAEARGVIVPPNRITAGEEDARSLVFSV